MTQPVVVFDQVTKAYRRTGRRDLRRLLPGHEPVVGTTVAAVQDIDLIVRAGEAVGIIGPNGVGKTTLLRMLAGVTAPSSGQVRTRGRIASMIDLGIGFDRELTGRENLGVSGRLLGLTAAELAARTEEVIEFAGIEDAIDDRLATYSTGMVARLGFAIATHVDADVLAVDEVLAVGDRVFREKCIRHIQGLVAGGTALLFVSHDLWLVNEVCDRVVRMHEGRVVADGDPEEITSAYAGVVQAGHASPPPDDVEARLDVVTPAVATLEPIVVGFTIDLPRPVPDPLLSFNFGTTLGGVRAVNRWPAPSEWFPVGTTRVRATCKGVPASAGDYFVEAVLQDGEAGPVVARVREPLLITGGERHPPRLVVPTCWTIEREGAVHMAVRTSPTTLTEPVIRAERLTKRFRARDSRRKLRGETVALADVSFTVNRGEALGVVGPNGAGKSTLLKVIAGVTRPTSGRFRYDGRLAAVIELGVGFHPDLSGLENIRIAGALLGLDGQSVTRLTAPICEFADIGEAIDRPVKHYSTGMRARLGFAVATVTAPDVLLLDEALSVGDLEFRARAYERVRTLLEQGTALVLVSHDMWMIEDLCSRVIVLERGRIVDDGATDAVLDRRGGIAWSPGEALGTAPVRVRSITLQQRSIDVGGRLDAEFVIEADEPMPHARVEVALRDPSGRQEARAMSHDEVEAYFTVSMSVAVPAEGPLSEAGCWVISGCMESVPLNPGPLDFVVTIIDEREGDVIAERFEPFRIRGHRSTGVGMDLDVAWVREP